MSSEVSLSGIPRDQLRHGSAPDQLFVGQLAHSAVSFALTRLDILASNQIEFCLDGVANSRTFQVISIGPRVLSVSGTLLAYWTSRFRIRALTSVLRSALSTRSTSLRHARR